MSSTKYGQSLKNPACERCTSEDFHSKQQHHRERGKALGNENSHHEIVATIDGEVLQIQQVQFVYPGSEACVQFLYLV